MKVTYFEIISYKVSANWSLDGGDCDAVVKLWVTDEKAKDKTFHVICSDKDFVPALFSAFKEALLPCFPKVKGIYLTGYTIKRTNTNLATNVANVAITFSDNKKEWRELGASTNMTVAVMEAIGKAFKKKLGLY